MKESFDKNDQSREFYHRSFKLQFLPLLREVETDAAVSLGLWGARTENLNSKVEA